MSSLDTQQFSFNLATHSAPNTQLFHDPGQWSNPSSSSTSFTSSPCAYPGDLCYPGGPQAQAPKPDVEGQSPDLGPFVVGGTIVTFPSTSPIIPYTQSPSPNTTTTKASKEKRIPRPANAFIIFRSDFLKRAPISQDMEKRQQKLSVIKAELAKEAHAIKYAGYKYRPRTRSRSKREPKVAAASGEQNYLSLLAEKAYAEIFGTPPPRKNEAAPLPGASPQKQAHLPLSAPSARPPASAVPRAQSFLCPPSSALNSFKPAGGTLNIPRLPPSVRPASVPAQRGPTVANFLPSSIMQPLSALLSPIMHRGPIAAPASNALALPSLDGGALGFSGNTQTLGPTVSDTGILGMFRAVPSRWQDWMSG
ncbi:hypothetical protein BC834DRAFT_970293 [Gloeopeniophorella convolvens]|nr:hypothetical protein BC834DRAFT_970293 [Gloeopeniophorella convolvens]